MQYQWRKGMEITFKVNKLPEEWKKLDIEHVFRKHGEHKRSVTGWGPADMLMVLAERGW